MGATQFLELADGRFAYDDTGEGPLIVATPAMLDLRSELLGAPLSGSRHRAQAALRTSIRDGFASGLTIEGVYARITRRLLAMVACR